MRTGALPQVLGKQGKARNSGWLQLVAQAIVEVPTAKEVIEAVRDEFGLVDPETKEHARENRKIARSTRIAIRTRLADELAVAEWPRDTFPTSCLNYVCRPEEIRAGVLSWADDGDGSTTEQERRGIGALAEIAYTIFTKAGFQALFSGLLVDLLLERAIDGSLKLPKALPSGFLGSVFALPFVFGDRIVVCLSSRYDDIYARCDQLQECYGGTFPGGVAHPKRRKRVRDMFILSLYCEIEEAQAEKSAHIQYMAKVLDVEEEDAAEMSIVDELLKRLLETEWAHELKGYQLETKTGRRAAKNFLSQVVYRERTLYKAIAKEVEAGPQVP